MSVSMFVYSGELGEREQLRIEPKVEPGDSCIWIRNWSDTVCLTLNPTDRAALRAALDDIDAAEAAQAVAA